MRNTWKYPVEYQNVILKKNEANQISTQDQTAGILHLFFEVPCFKAQNRQNSVFFHFKLAFMVQHNHCCHCLLNIFNIQKI